MLCHKIEREASFPNMFCEDCIILLPKTYTDTVKRENDRQIHWMVQIQKIYIQHNVLGIKFNHTFQRSNTLQ
jgi:hypothetical protein